MIIKKVAIGNSKEAFIENRLSNGVNIIYSNDNNKGKTIIIQSISFVLGASDTFPAGIDISKYYVYLKCEINNKNVEIIRKKSNGFLVLYNDELHIFDTVSEFRYFFDGNISKLPKYMKDGREKLVDFPVYYEMSLIPQDKRNPSNIINKTGTNKLDFLQMVASIMNCGYSNIVNSDEVERDIRKTKIEISALSKKISFAKENAHIYKNLSSTFNKEDYDLKKQKISELESEMSALARKRTTECNRIIKLNNLITELRSIGKRINDGYFVCSECGSLAIKYKKGDIVFDTSNSDVRSNIINAISRQIEVKNAIISEFNTNTDKIIEEKNLILKSVSSEANNYFIYLNEINNLSSNIEEFDRLSKKLDDLKREKTNLQNVKNKDKEEYKKVMKLIIDSMNDLQQRIESNSATKYSDIFTTQSNVFSGSTENEYYFCRCVALANVLKHELPIIIDSFRDGETSTAKENNMVSIYKKLEKQVILTSTLKDEEFMNKDKYEAVSGITAINYEPITTYKLLQESFVKDFISLIEKFGIDLK